jgi:hypothetical protein
VGGGFGTLSEIALALRAGRTVAALATWDLDPEGAGGAPFVKVATPEEAVSLVLAHLGRE